MCVYAATKICNYKSTVYMVTVYWVYMVNPKRKKNKNTIYIDNLYRQIILKTINENRNKDSICITFHLDLQQYHFDNSD